jgi:NADH-quinone oxidoreductase subunit H
MEIMDIALKITYALIVVGVVMTLCGYSVLAERKVSAWIQGRVGPNRTSLPFIEAIPIVGPMLKRLGIWQPLADGLKFLFKEDPVPGHVNKTYYYLAPVMSLLPALLTLTVIPFGEYWDANGKAQPLMLANIDIGILFVFAISSLGVYGIVFAGWSANSKYPFFGAIRSSAQMISYELAMALSVLPVLIWANPAGTEGGLTLWRIVESQEHLWLVFMQPVSALIFLVALFAETNRLPFDMPESETELVGGFHTEYGAFKFGMFFLAEYAHMVIGSAVFVLLFLGGWDFLPGIHDTWPHTVFGAAMSVMWFLFKVLACMFFFIWVRWTLPRFRYDQVMKIGWNILLPLAIVNLIAYMFIIAAVDKF